MRPERNEVKRERSEARLKGASSKNIFQPSSFLFLRGKSLNLFFLGEGRGEPKG